MVGEKKLADQEQYVVELHRAFSDGVDESTMLVSEVSGTQAVEQETGEEEDGLESICHAV